MGPFASGVCAKDISSIPAHSPHTAIHSGTGPPPQADTSIRDTLWVEENTKAQISAQTLDSGAHLRTVTLGHIHMLTSLPPILAHTH